MQNFSYIKMSHFLVVGAHCHRVLVGFVHDKRGVARGNVRGLRSLRLEKTQHSKNEGTRRN
jgi:hypothetical protein